MAPAAPDTSRATRVVRVVQLCTCCLRSMSQHPPHLSLFGRLPRSTATPPPSQGSFGQKGDSVTANGQMGETVYKVRSQFLLVVRNSKYPKTRGIVGEDSANR